MFQVFKPTEPNITKYSQNVSIQALADILPKIFMTFSSREYAFYGEPRNPAVSISVQAFNSLVLDKPERTFLEACVKMKSYDKNRATFASVIGYKRTNISRKRVAQCSTEKK